MQFVLSRQFEKDFAKLTAPKKKKVLAALQKFVDNPLDPTLRSHRLSGRYHDHLSIDVTGDLRAVYKYLEANDVYFITLGTHSQLYG